MTQNRYYSSTTKTTMVAADPGTTGTSLQVADSTVFASLDGKYPYTLAINWGQADQELVDVTGRPDDTHLTIVRGQDGTGGISHAVGATVSHDVSARDFNDAGAHAGASSGVHGIAGAVVGTTDTQALSNKSTLDSFTVGGNLAVAGNLTVGGSMPTVSSYVTKTASYTLTASDMVVGGDATSAPITLTLPTAVGATGRVYTLRKIDTGTNTVTIATTSGQNIGTWTTMVLRTPHLTVTVISDGSRWQITNITSADPPHTMTLQNGWTVNSGGQNVTYQAVGLDQIAVSGYITGGTTTDNTTIATLPVGYRMLNVTNSASQPIYVSASITKVPVMFLDNAGNLKIYYVPAGPLQIQFNITFRTAS